MLTTPPKKRSSLNPTAAAFKNDETPLPSTPPPGTQFVLSWDTERSGPRTDMHSLLGIGAVVMRVKDKEIMAKFRELMKLEDGHVFGPITQKEYWLNWQKFPMNKQILAEIDKNGVSATIGIQRFAAWLDVQERTYTEAGMALVSDNPATDGKWVSHYFQKYLDRNPMVHPYGDETRYRRYHHSNAFARGVSLDDGSGGNWRKRLVELDFKMPKDSLHNHDPLSDAMWTAYLYVECLHFVHSMRYDISVDTEAAAAEKEEKKKTCMCCNN